MHVRNSCLHILSKSPVKGMQRTTAPLLKILRVIISHPSQLLVRILESICLICTVYNTLSSDGLKYLKFEVKVGVCVWFFILMKFANSLLASLAEG